MALLLVFPYIEGALFCFGSGVFAAAQPKEFLKVLADSPNPLVVADDVTLFVTRLFGITSAALGASLFTLLPEAKRSTRNTLLACMLIGDTAQMYFAHRHARGLGGERSFNVLIQFLTGGGLALCRVAVLLGGY